MKVIRSHRRGSFDQVSRNAVLVGDALMRLRQLPSDSIDCVVTSPPYYGLRDYHAAGQIGLEESVHEWVDRLRVVFIEVKRVLKPTGSLWLNLGDSYSRHIRLGAPPKGQLLGPERLLLMLTQGGWLCRNKVVWSKTNAMPTSIADRLNTTHDFVYFLVRSPRYFFDLDLIREPHTSSKVSKGSIKSLEATDHLGPLAMGSNAGLAKAKAEGRAGHALGKNPGDVWRLSASSYKGAHFATFPPSLIEKPILATCPERVCQSCGKAWTRRSFVDRVSSKNRSDKQSRDPHVRRYNESYSVIRSLGPLVPCGCNAPTRPGIVLDPFFGTGTVGEVALKHGRDFLGIELNPEYVKLAERRIAAVSTTEKPKAPYTTEPLAA